MYVQMGNSDVRICERSKKKENFQIFLIFMFKSIKRYYNMLIYLKIHG